MAGPEFFWTGSVSQDPTDNNNWDPVYTGGHRIVDGDVSQVDMDGNASPLTSTGFYVTESYRGTLGSSAQPVYFATGDNFVYRSSGHAYIRGDGGAFTFRDIDSPQRGNPGLVFVGSQNTFTFNWVSRGHVTWDDTVPPEEVGNINIGHRDSLIGDVRVDILTTGWTGGGHGGPIAPRIGTVLQRGGTCNFTGVGPSYYLLGGGVATLSEIVTSSAAAFIGIAGGATLNYLTGTPPVGGPIEVVNGTLNCSVGALTQTTQDFLIPTVYENGKIEIVNKNTDNTDPPRIRSFRGKIVNTIGVDNLEVIEHNWPL